MSDSSSGLNLQGAANSLINAGTINGVAGSAILASGSTDLDNRGTISGDIVFGGWPKHP